LTVCTQSYILIPMGNDQVESDDSMRAVVRRVRHDKRSLERNPVNRHRRSRGMRLMWEVYAVHLATGESGEDLAAKFGIGKGYANDLLRRARIAMEAAHMFNPNAANLHQEMLKFVPLAATALEKNLVDAHPAVTVAFLQGVGALVPKAEISRVSEEERVQHVSRSAAAINPRLKRALGIEDGVVVSVSTQPVTEDNSKD
jgi:hypothetical protein